MAGINLSNDRTRLIFDPQHGGRIAQVWFDDRPLLVESSPGIDPLFGWGCYPMVPWAGRLAGGRFQFRRDVVHMPANSGPNAMHGLGMSHPWQVVASATSSVVARLELNAVGWPFSAWCEQRIALGPTTIHMEMSVHSTEREFPAQVGWHPWFCSPETIRVSFDTMYVRDDAGLTTTATCPPTAPPWDDCFAGVVNSPALTVNGVSIELSSTCRYWVVYTEDPRGVCIEPQSGIPNAFNSLAESGLDIVGPARVLRHSFSWDLSR